MSKWKLAFKPILTGIPLLLGVTWVSFLLMVYFGPDLSYTMAGKNPSTEQLQLIRHNLGYDQGFWHRYLAYLKELVTFDFGHSMYKDQKVTSMISNALPTTFYTLLPGFLLGHVISLVLAMLAARHQGRFIDKVIMTGSVIGMSISFLVVIVAFQLMFSSVHGLDWFPVRGWRIHGVDGQWSWSLYLQYVAVPTMAILFVTLGYNTRFYRAILVDEQDKEHIMTAQAYGHSTFNIYGKHLLKNALIPLMTRFLFSIPLVFISGALLIESHFGIPGMGQLTYDAIMAGDQPILKAVIALTAVGLVLMMMFSDLINSWVDPRLRDS